MGLPHTNLSFQLHLTSSCFLFSGFQSPFNCIVYLLIKDFAQTISHAQNTSYLNFCLLKSYSVFVLRVECSRKQALRWSLVWRILGSAFENNFEKEGKEAELGRGRSWEVLQSNKSLMDLKETSRATMVLEKYLACFPNKVLYNSRIQSKIMCCI